MLNPSLPLPLKREREEVLREIALRNTEGQREEECATEDLKDAWTLVTSANQRQGR